MKINLNRIPISDKIKIFNQLYEDISGKGIGGDTELAHVNKYEACILRALGGSGNINPLTNLTQYMGGGGQSGGGGGGGQHTTSTVQKNEIPEYFKPYALEMVETASQVYDEPYEAYTGQRLADVTPTQAAAYTGLEQFYSEVDPITGERVYADPTAAGFEQASTLTGTGGQQFGDMAAGQFQEKYMSPYQQAVTDVALTEAQRQGSIQKQELLSQAGKAGAYGGSRQAILEAEHQRNLNRQLTDIQAAGSQKAFEAGTTAFDADRVAALKAGQQFGALAPAAASSNLTGLGALQTLGETQRGIAQQPLDINYEEFVRQRDYPAKQTQEYSGIIQGFPMQPSTYTTAQEFTQPPTLGSQLLSAGALYSGIQSGLGKGFFGGAGASGGLVGLAEGGPVEFQEGGPAKRIPVRAERIPVRAAGPTFRALAPTAGRALIPAALTASRAIPYPPLWLLSALGTGAYLVWKNMSEEDKEEAHDLQADEGEEPSMVDPAVGGEAVGGEAVGGEGMGYIEDAMGGVAPITGERVEEIIPEHMQPSTIPEPTIEEVSVVEEEVIRPSTPMGFTEQIGAINPAAPEAWRSAGGPIGFADGGIAGLLKAQEKENQDRKSRLIAAFKRASPKKTRRKSAANRVALLEKIRKAGQKRALESGGLEYTAGSSLGEIPEEDRFVNRLLANRAGQQRYTNPRNQPYTDLSGLAASGGLMSLSNGGPIRFQTGDEVSLEFDEEAHRKKMIGVDPVYKYASPEDVRKHFDLTTQRKKVESPDEVSTIRMGEMDIPINILDRDLESILPQSDLQKLAGPRGSGQRREFLDKRKALLELQRIQPLEEKGLPFKTWLRKNEAGSFDPVAATRPMGTGGGEYTGVMTEVVEEPKHALERVLRERTESEEKDRAGIEKGLAGILKTSEAGAEQVSQNEKARLKAEADAIFKQVHKYDNLKQLWGTVFGDGMGRGTPGTGEYNSAGERTGFNMEKAMPWFAMAARLQARGQGTGEAVTAAINDYATLTNQAREAERDDRLADARQFYNKAAALGSLASAWEDLEGGTGGLSYDQIMTATSQVWKQAKVRHDLAKQAVEDTIDTGGPEHDRALREEKDARALLSTITEQTNKTLRSVGSPLGRGTPNKAYLNEANPDLG
jgi:hypothetical protein